MGSAQSHSETASCTTTMQAHHHLLQLLLLSPVLASPLPQEGLESAQPVVLLQPTSFENVFAGFPHFGQFERFPSFSGFDKLDIPHPPQIELKDIFGANKEQPLNPVGECGLICKVFTEQGEYDNQTETYQEKVLPDGSVLRINKTLVQDTDEEGNGFFFQSSIHQILTDDEYTEDEIEDNAEEIEDVEEDIEDTVNSSPVVNDDDDDEGLGFVDEDPTFNEVLDEKFPTASVEDLLDRI